MIETVESQSHRRLGRLRQRAALRDVFRETRLSPQDFVLPIFVAEHDKDAGGIASLPGVRRHALGELPRVIDGVKRAGVRAVLLFGVPGTKDESGSAAAASDGVIPRAIERIKVCAPDLAVMTDVCLCQYTSSGRCVVHDEDAGEQRATLDMLGLIAVAHARAGADVVAPSGMIDGGVRAIRSALDDAGHDQTAILAYSAKFASCLYGPFREAARSAPSVGDRSQHQLDPANTRESLAEVAQDVAEDADAVMVKPAGSALDVIARVRESMPGVPLAAYQVGGEYAMIAAAAARGWVDERSAILESLVSIKRAGAGAIVTYAAVRAAEWLCEREDRSP